MKLKQKIFSLLMIIIFVLAGNFSVLAAEKAVVAVTIVPQIEMLKAVGGNKIEVVEMIPQGFSPSNYAPSPAEMRAFDQASIYFSIGVPADIQNILPRAKARKKLKVVKLFQEIENKYPHRYFGEETKTEIENEEHKQETEPGHHGGRDPHIWLSPARAKLMVKIIRDELIEILPEYELDFRKNAEKYLAKLTKIDQENKELLGAYQGEKILVYHPSFGYFTDHYSLDMVAIEAEGKDPGPRHLEKIIQLAQSENISSVFYQAEIDSTKTRAVAEELNGDLVQLDPLAKNYSENLKIMAQKIASVLAERADN